MDASERFEMQAASLQGSFNTTRSDTFGGSGSGSAATAFKSAFDSAISDRAAPEPVERATPQDVQPPTRPERKERIANEKVDEVDDVGSVDAAEATSKAEKTAAADNDATENETSDESAVESKPAVVNDDEVDPADAEMDPALVALAAGVAVDAAAQANPADASQVPAEFMSEDAIDPNAAPVTPQAAMLAAEAKPANGKTEQTAKPASKLDDLVAQMEATDSATESAEQQASSDADAQQQGESSPDLLPDEMLDPTAAKEPAHAKADASTFDRATNALQAADATAPKQDVGQAAKVQAPIVMTPEQQFAHDNIDSVVTSVRTQSVAGGGSMNVRLDPPELGALQVAIKMVEGRLTASFTTNNEQATQLLSHNLQHLKSSLEASGVAVDRIEVRQAPQADSSQSKSNSDSQQQQQQRGLDSQSQHSEQQRKEMVRKMWQKLAYGSDDLDLVA